MDVFAALSFGILGAILGSFIGVVAERVHTGERWVRGRSRCNSCARELGPLELVPVISWLLILGRCRSCGSRIPAGYLALELALASLFALAFVSLGFSFALVPFLLVLLVLAFIVAYDLRHTLVPLQASALLFVSSLVFALLAAPSMGALGLALIGAGVTGLVFLALHVFSRGRAMGLGDAPVAFSLALLAAPYALSGFLFSFWIGGLFGIVVLFVRRRRPTMGIEVPFVPFLAAGYLLAFFTQWNPF